MKNKILSILLFTCLVAPVPATFLWLKHQKKNVRKEVKWKIIAGIDKEDLVLLKFTKTETRTQLKWKHSKEFEYNGHLYDIVETETKGDSVYYFCWWDYEETDLNKELDELASLAFGNNSKNQENQKRLFKLFKSLYFSKSSGENNFTHQEVSNEYLLWQSFYQSTTTSPPAPPPQMA